jgi:MFS family permease
MFFSIQGAGVNFLTSAGAFLAGMILDNNDTNVGFFLCFFLGFLAMMLSYVLLAQVKEEASTETLTEEESEPILKSAVNILKNDKDFRSFVIVRFLVPFGTMATAFFTIFIIKQFNADAQTVGYMTSALFISTVIAGLILGWISDHIGRKFAMLLALALVAATAFLAFFAKSLDLFYVIFILTGVVNGSFWSVFLSFSLEFGTNKTRPTYVGLVNTLIAPSTLIAQLLGGLLADSVSYQTTFLTAGIFGSFTFLITLFFVNIPKAKNNQLPA